MLTLLLQATLSLFGCPLDLHLLFDLPKTIDAGLCSAVAADADYSRQVEDTLPRSPKHPPQSQCPACFCVTHHSDATADTLEPMLLPPSGQPDFALAHRRLPSPDAAQRAHNRDPPLSLRA
jgi:hypothetical protein